MPPKRSTTATPARIPQIETNFKKPDHDHAARRGPARSSRCPRATRSTCSPRKSSFPTWRSRCSSRSTPRAGCGSATMPSYPQYLPGTPPNDKILILEDTNGDGKADKQTVFADKLYLPTGIEFWNGGVIVAQQPNLMFLKDTNGDDKADTRETDPARLRLGRLAPRDQRVHVRSGRRALLPGRDVPPHAGRNALRPRARASTPASSATSRGPTSSTSSSPTASPTRGATSSTAGARTSSPTPRAAPTTSAPPSPATSTIRTSTAT